MHYVFLFSLVIPLLHHASCVSGIDVPGNRVGLGVPDAIWSLLFLLFVRCCLLLQGLAATLREGLGDEVGLHFCAVDPCQ